MPKKNITHSIALGKKTIVQVNVATSNSDNHTDELRNNAKVWSTGKEHAADDGDDEVGDGQEHHCPLGIYGGEEEDKTFKNKVKPYE